MIGTPCLGLNGSDGYMGKLDSFGMGCDSSTPPVLEL